MWSSWVRWWRMNWRWLLASVAGAVSVALTAIFLRRRYQDALARAEMSKTLAKVTGIQREREVRRKRMVKADAEDRRLAGRVAELRRQALSVVTDVEDMTDVEVVKALRDLGYD